MSQPAPTPPATPAKPAPAQAAAPKPGAAATAAQTAGGPTPAPGAPKPQPAPAPRGTEQVVVTGFRRVLVASLVLLVILPSLIAGWYLWARASDQYVSTVAFSVRKENAAASLDLLGGLSAFGGTGSASDTDILHDFLRSEDIVATIDGQLDLRDKFARNWPHDWFYAYNPAGTIEDLTDYWRDQVKVDYDNASKLITLRVAAFTAQDARDIAQAAFDESSRTINRLSDIARDDSTRFARAELAKAQDRLTKARQALTAFRMRTQIVDPAADLAGQMGVITQLQSQLAEALVAYDTLRETAQENDPRAVQARQKIEAIRKRIADERDKFGAGGKGPGGESYAQLMAEYERLAVDLQFAEAGYTSAHTALDIAIAEGLKQSRYLVAHIQPKLAEASIVPNRPLTLFLVFSGLLLIWSIMLLIYFSIRDRR
ncbi:capsule biosynthesis protein [Paracoccus jiaweipingae]|uniref:capsule biosynthesis protein n=1 Tax=unclassified Paracoccus (in: a-proteobacteria) TaxID=2688777 RepID=UPI0037B55E81